ncbi:tape measure protein [Microbacterium bovistercoris]|uniref:tape measure protein n=1 Tax=Microbacterium bovistercoris TaxID=2293570 RepID=UPI0015F274C1|nr:tape measure protein [Microbacterium bovistercoris]
MKSTLAGSGKSMGAVLAGAVGGAVAAVTSKAIGTVMESIDGAIRRVDTMNNFPKIMQNLGFSAKDASKSIKLMSDKLTGLPTSLDAMAGMVQQLAPLTGGLKSATDLSLALNNALLAGGKSTDIQANALEQYVQQLAVGKVDMAAWRSLVSAMPGQMDQLSKSLLGGTAKQTDLYAAMQSGKLSFDQFNGAILDLNKNGFGKYASFAAQAKDATQGIATAQTNLGTAVTRGLANIIQKFQPQITAAFAAVTAAVNDTFKAISATFHWIGANLDWLAPLGVGLGVATGGFVAMGAASTVAAAGGLAKWIAATKLGTGIQLAFNAVMNANPIMLIVSAISALVAGLVYFFTQTKLGKEIWANFTRFLGEAWANIQAFFTSAWENVIQPVFKAIGEIATWLWETILKPVFDFIAGAVQLIGGVFKFYFDLIVNYFRLWGAIAMWLWDNALKPAINAIGAAFNWLWTNAIKPVIDAIVTAAQWLWTNGIKPYFDLIGLGIRTLGAGFDWLYRNAVKPAWDAISGALQAGWAWIEKNVFAPFKTGIDLVAKGFEIAKASIAKTWDGIKQAAAVPINFVLDTVWNNGLRSFWNDLVTNLGLKDMKLPKAPLVKFASGGVLPGYTPGRDVHEFWSPTGGRLALSGGEAIMRPEFTRAVGGAAGVARLNMLARSGAAFKNGGVWGDFGNFAGDVWDNIASAAQVAGEFLANPMKAIQKHVIDGIIRPLMGGQNLFGKAVGQLPINLVKQLAKNFGGGAGAGKAGTGWQAMWNLIKANIPGAVMTGNYRSPSRNAAVGGAKGSYHMQGRAIDLIPASMAMFNAVKRLFPNATELIYTPAGRAQLRNGRPFAGWSDAVKRQHYNHVHLAMAGGGVIPQLFDQGGWLPHGGVAVNRSGKPEPVLTNDQWRAMGRGLQAGDRLRLVVDGREFNAYVDDRVDGILDASFDSPQQTTSEFGK